MPTSHLEDLTAIGRERIDDLRGLQKAGLVCTDGDFFPSVHYPPITMYPPTTPDVLFADYTAPEDGLFDVYVHLPFCKRRCVFCHYPAKLGDQASEKDRYLAALEREMDIYMDCLSLDRIKVRSILVGGGTPTHLTPAQLTRFLDFFVKRLDMSQCSQFNYDVDPSTLVGSEGIERLRIMRSYGVDRLTIGVQSFNDGVLKKMNRPHDSRGAFDSIENSKAEGYKINIEFIYGYPGQTLANWIDNVEKAVALDLEEIQLYRLKVMAYGDFQGPVKKTKEAGRDCFPSIEETFMMKQLAISILNRNGYHENLRRVYSKERRDFSHYAHNQCCMLYDQIGFGLTGFSSLRDRFALNTQDFGEYYVAIADGHLPLNRGLVRTPEDQIRWSVILPLKNRSVRKSYFQRLTGVSLDETFRTKIANLKAFGLLHEDDRELKLTDLGAFFADEVAEQFHHPDYMPFPSTAYADGPLHPYKNCAVFDQQE